MEETREKNLAKKTCTGTPGANASSGTKGGGLVSICDNNTNAKMKISVYNKMITNQNDHNTLKGRHSQLIKLLKEEKERNESLRGEKVTLSNTNNELRVRLNESQAALRDAGRSSKSERSKDITNETKRQIKRTTFRHHKFARDNVLTRICEELYGELADRLHFDEVENPLSKEDYCRIYSGVVSQELSARRQYVQTRCQAVCQGKPQNNRWCLNI